MTKRLASIAIVLALVLLAPSLVFAAATSEDEVALNVLLYGDASKWTPVYDAYMESHPNVTVEYEFVDDGSILRARTNAGDYPDAWMTETYADLVQYNDVLYDFSQEDWIDEVAAWTLEASTIDGRILAVPNSIQGYGIVYNKDLFEQAGITEVPTTQDELETVAEQLSAAGITPFETGYGEGWPIHQMYAAFMEYDLPGNDYTKLSTGEVTFSDLEINDNYFRFIDLMAKYSEGNPLDSSFTDQGRNVALGEVAMTHQGDWLAGSIFEANPDANIGFFANPVNNNPADTKLNINPANQWVVYADGPNAQAALDLIEWHVVSAEGTAHTGEFFVVPSANAPQPTNPLKQDVLRLALENKGRPWAYPKWPSGLTDFVQQLTQEYLLGTKTPDDFDIELQTAWEDLD